MVFSNFPQAAEKFEIQAYKRPRNLKTLRETHIAFSGSPRKHPFDDTKIVLITDPLSMNTFYYEFKTGDISFVEELPSLVNPDGETIVLVRIWVKKQSIGVRCTPFIVEDTRVR